MQDNSHLIRKWVSSRQLQRPTWYLCWHTSSLEPSPSFRFSSQGQRALAYETLRALIQIVYLRCTSHRVFNINLSFITFPRSTSMCSYHCRAYCACQCYTDNALLRNCVGVLFSGVGVVESACDLLASVIYNSLYPAVKKISPGFCFFIMAIALIVPLALTMWALGTLCLPACMTSSWLEEGAVRFTEFGFDASFTSHGVPHVFDKVDKVAVLIRFIYYLLQSITCTGNSKVIGCQKWNESVRAGLHLMQL